MRFRIWLPAVATSHAAEKNSNIGAVHNCSPSGAQQLQTYFGKFTSCMTFGAHKLVRCERFFDYLYEL